MVLPSDTPTPTSSPTPTSAPGNHYTLTLAPAVSTAAYVAQPAYAEVTGNKTYRVQQLPSWASLNASTGEIYGTPPQAGSAQLAIEVSNGSVSAVYSGTLTIDQDADFARSALRSFYAQDFDGNPRQLRNDLQGGLAAEVQFVQSHAVAPNGNFQRNTADETKSRYMPKLTAQREAMVLLMPQGDTKPSAVQAQLLQDGVPVMTLSLNSPTTLPASDVAGDKVTYSDKAWWAIIPWQHVRQGMSLRFSSNGQTGELAAASIDMGEATQLVIKSIRLGMLTDPLMGSAHWTLIDPVMAASDYFQTLPVSKVVLGSYANMSLKRVIIASGRIYDQAVDGSSAVEGGWHAGDMRENVGKSQVSIGINLADMGQTSNNMAQSYSRKFKQITTHYAWGQYTNGFINHGGSGGNGIATLTNGQYNEPSHEWGHDYGLGHYPGKELTTDGRWQFHHADSGWGYNTMRHRMRASFKGIKADGSYDYTADAMAGGESASPFSKYTFYTGFSARNIQNELAGYAIPDAAYPSGYKIWNSATGQYADYTKDVRPKPKKVGVPVATILGGYDPDGKASGTENGATVSYANNAVIYPVFHGNYGNVFDLPEPDLSGSANPCWVTVNNAAGDIKNIAIAATRNNPNTVNQLHFNLDADFRPTLAVLRCRRDGTTIELTRTAFDGQIPPLPPLAIVGQEAGIEQIKAREFAEIDAALQAAGAIQALPAGIADKVASYERAELLAALSADSRSKLSAAFALQDASASTQVLLQHAKATGWSDAQTAASLRLHLQSTGLLKGSMALPAAEIYGNAYFFDGSPGAGQQVLLTQQSVVPQAQRSQWVQDGSGRIHLASQPDLCLTPNGSLFNLAACQTQGTSQSFEYFNSNTNPWVLKRVGTNSCMDFDRGNVRLISYGCTANWNQKWYGISVSQEPWLQVLGADALKEVGRLLLQNP